MLFNLTFFFYLCFYERLWMSDTWLEHIYSIQIGSLVILKFIILFLETMPVQKSF